mmetsp:Transcript_11133/g.35337  ORF Transcript_11133/g.35337 Transcript_11133/m.35337 type:complete len:205 (+) Transcript_11133:105-719(+)
MNQPSQASDIITFYAPYPLRRLDARIFFPREPAAPMRRTGSERERPGSSREGSSGRGAGLRGRRGLGGLVPGRRPAGLESSSILTSLTTSILVSWSASCIPQRHSCTARVSTGCRRQTSSVVRSRRNFISLARVISSGRTAPPLSACSLATSRCMKVRHWRTTSIPMASSLSPVLRVAARERDAPAFFVEWREVFWAGLRATFP